MDQKEYREYHRELELLQEKIVELRGTLDNDTLKKKLAELQAETLKEDFWKDKERVAEVNQKIHFLRKKTEPWDRLSKSVADTLELMDLAMDEGDEAVLEDSCRSIGSLKSEFERLESLELLSGEDDDKNAYVTIHPGAGGTESQDWANMLFRMYYRWCEKSGITIDVIDYTPGEEAGIKSATMFLKGGYAYGMLKGERGIHRLVRISPFDSNKRRHTSFASVEVIPEVTDEIDIQINETDLRIDTYRSSGAGGQHVNKTDSAVRITHLPTGIVVQCQNERSQHKNKAFAMKVLKSRLYDIYRKEKEEKQQEKIGEKKDISWGNQIRSYVFQPYTLVKDHRTGEETGSIEYVFDGDIDRFIYAFLKQTVSRVRE
ncbi:MAG: peptide chain release factor 2 [Spirochaetes bacterium]|nr:peptide chain release factor 2 [Spirochaetota bacterium]